MLLRWVAKWALYGVIKMSDIKISNEMTCWAALSVIKTCNNMTRWGAKWYCLNFYYLKEALSAIEQGKKSLEGNCCKKNYEAFEDHEQWTNIILRTYW